MTGEPLQDTSISTAPSLSRTPPDGPSIAMASSGAPSTAVSLSHAPSVKSMSSQADLLHHDSTADTSNHGTPLGMPMAGGHRQVLPTARMLFRETGRILRSKRFKHEALRTTVALLVFTTVTGLMMIAQMHSDAWFDEYTKKLALSVQKLKTMATFRTVFAVDPLHDRLFSIIPDWSDWRGWFPDLFLSSFIASCVLFNVLWVRRARIQFQGLVVLRRFLWILSVLYLFRMMTFMVTTIPNPIHNCVPKYARVADFAAYLELIGDMASGQVSACTDNIYSGHTAMAVLIVFTFWMYSGSWVLQVYALVHGLLAISAILVTRLHYTVDVLIAMFMSAFVFLIFHFLLTIMLDDQLIDTDPDAYTGEKLILANERRTLHRVYNGRINKIVWWIDGFDLRLKSREIDEEDAELDGALGPQEMLMEDKRPESPTDKV